MKARVGASLVVLVFPLLMLLSMFFLLHTHIVCEDYLFFFVFLAWEGGPRHTFFSARSTNVSFLRRFANLRHPRQRPFPRPDGRRYPHLHVCVNGVADCVEQSRVSAVSSDARTRNADRLVRRARHERGMDTGRDRPSRYSR